MSYLEKEMMVIGCCLISNAALLSAREEVKREDFLDSRTASAWDVITDMDDRGASVDLVSITSELHRREMADKIGGYAFLSKACEIVPAPSQVKKYAAEIRETSTLARLKGAFADLSKQAEKSQLEPLLNSAEDIIYKAREGRETIAVYRSVEIGEASIALHHEALSNPSHSAGVPHGIEGLEMLIPGFQPCTLTYIGARPGIGKTSLACELASNVMYSHNVLIISLEMAMAELSARLMSAELGVSAELINRGLLPVNKQDEMRKVAEKFKSAKLSVIDKAGLSYSQIRAIARREKANNRLDMLIIDHFQIVNTPGKAQRYHEFTELSVNLKRLAKELKIPVICLAQLSRQAADEEPEIHHLKETGGLEQDADIIILMHKPAPDTRKLVLKVGKHRAGRIGQLEYIFNPEILEFKPMITHGESLGGNDGTY